MINTAPPEVFAAALTFAKNGFTPLPLTGKKCLLTGWTELKGVNADTVRGWQAKGILQNVGLLCGKHGGNLVVIDFDGHPGYDAFCVRFPVLAETHTVLTGSGNGNHCYYIVENLPPSKKVSGIQFGEVKCNIEIKSTGTQIVAPPSIHPDTGKPYVVINPARALRLPDLNEVVQWIAEMKGEDDLETTRSDAPNTPVMTGKQAQAYTQAAYLAELNELRGRGVGERNSELFKTAANVYGKMYGGWEGMPSEATISADLKSAGLALGLEVGEINATLASARRSANPQPPPALKTSAPPSSNGQSGHTPPGTPPIQPPAASAVLRYGKQISERYRQRLHGQITYEGSPIKIPIQALWRYGGFAHKVPAGKSIGLIAPSGGGKTTMTETFNDLWLQAGVNTVLWSPEWTDDELMDRRVQRYGGVSADTMLDYAMYCNDFGKGIPADKCAGRVLSADEIAHTEKVLNAIEQWRGQSIVYQDPEAKLEDMFSLLEVEIAHLRKDQRNAIVWIIDYASLLNTHERLYGNLIQERVLKVISFCRRMHIVSFITQQVTKEASRSTKDGKVLGAEAGHWLRPDFFSLFLGIEPEYVGDDDQMTGEGVLRILKNNNGRLGDVAIRNNFERKMWEVIVPKAPTSDEEIDF